MTPASGVDGYSRGEPSRYLIRPEDRELEQRIAGQLEQAWQCQLVSFGEGSWIDWYAMRNGLPVAAIELKGRVVPSTKFTMLYLSWRKWIALTSAARMDHIKAVVVWSLADGLFWCRPNELTDCRVIMAGRTDRGRANDWEPVLLVPVARLRRVIPLRQV